jgi:hypothetical protein
MANVTQEAWDRLVSDHGGVSLQSPNTNGAGGIDSYTIYFKDGSKVETAGSLSDGTLEILPGKDTDLKPVKDATTGTETPAQKAQREAAARASNATADRTAAETAALGQPKPRDPGQEALTGAQTAEAAARTAQVTAATRTPAERDADIAHTQAQTGAATASAANSADEAAKRETPQQRADRERANIIATANAQADALIREKFALVGAGLDMPEKDKLELQNQLSILHDQTVQQLRDAAAAADFERERPFKEGAQRIAEQNAASLEQQRQDTATYQQQQAQTSALQVKQSGEAQQRADTLNRAKTYVDSAQKQSAATGDQFFAAAQKGTAPPTGAGRLVLGPLEQAYQVMQRMVQGGELDPNAIPQMGPPTPDGYQPGPPPPAPTGGPPPPA